MTIRRRLSIFYTLLVTIVLIVVGFGVHFLLKKSLEQNLDRTMLETGKIIFSSFEYDEHDEGPHFDTEAVSNDIEVIVFDEADRVVSSLGQLSGSLSKYLQLNEGFSWFDNKRVYMQNLLGYRIVLLQETTSIRQTLDQFKRVYETIIPFVILISFVLGSLLAKQALKPVAKLTKAANQLAQSQTWQQKLPEPKVKDELWELSIAFNKLLSSLKNLIETEKRFTSDASHELRTPLTVLRGRLDQILENPDDKDNIIRLKKAQEKTTELSNIVENLLQLARAEAGQGLKKERLALDELVFGVVEEMRSLYAAKGIRLEPNLPQTPAYIMADRFTVNRLIRNLLENSLKFSDKGIVKVFVSTKAEKAILTVTDNGIGIKEKDLEKVFDRFFQADASHQQSGSGLGLAIVKSIADWHNAKIELTSQENKGTQFKIIFPQVS